MAPNEKRGLKASLSAANERITELQGEICKKYKLILTLQTMIAKMIKTPRHVCPHEVGLEGCWDTALCLFHSETSTDEEKAHAHAKCWMVALNPRRKK